ncbi:hypothetical protein [Candidatus Nitrospira neomarina]|uniref:HEPN domain-containing protein n=1 Tax=Candidatus Nitrospira neomarina TaxID=3020899 RepID=A0AA96GH00_9BACT|nr:hypothetical protein [Candidatus Nitrospira neomarina]WNM61072.1 hypothetical protein PQG83_15090 [Candidatus Nitrospira neomarina]
MIKELPNNEEDFQQLMEEVDSFLRRNNVPIPYRQLRGALEISRRFHLRLPSIRDDKEPKEGSYVGADLKIRIKRWFDIRYGERLKKSLGPGRMVFSLRGDPWIFKFPKVYGQGFRFFCHSIEESFKPEPTSGMIPKFNILDSIIDLPSSLRRTLNSSELKGIWGNFQIGFNALSKLQYFSGNNLVFTALADHEASVHNLSQSSPSYGNAKWSSLLFTEKLLKGFIKESGHLFTYDHDLMALADKAISSGLPKTEKSLIALIQCKAGVRYGDPAVSLENALDAHRASLEIALQVAEGFNLLRNPNPPM